MLECDESNNINLYINNYHKYDLKYTFKNNNNIVDSKSIDRIHNDTKIQNLYNELKEVIFNYNNYNYRQNKNGIFCQPIFYFNFLFILS